MRTAFVHGNITAEGWLVSGLKDMDYDNLILLFSAYISVGYEKIHLKLKLDVFIISERQSN